MTDPDRPKDSADDPGPERVEEKPAMELHAIFDMLSRTPDAREDLVSEIRQQIADGSYMTEDRLNVAIYRLLRDILSD